MANWKDKDPEIAKIYLKGALDDKHDPKVLEIISKEATLPSIQNLAAEYKEELEGYLERAEKYDPKCPKCGAPLVEVPYYTAIKEGAIVTNIKTEWKGGMQQKTVSYKTPYKDIRLHTDTFCPRCAARKKRWLFYPLTFMFFGGLLASLVFGVMLIMYLVNNMENEQQGIMSVIGLAAGILSSCIGFKLTELLNLSRASVAWASKKKPPINTEEYKAREQGTAFYGPDELFPWSSYDLSVQYITSKRRSAIPHEETANTILPACFVRQMQEQNREQGT